jgi:hypothetical protein
VIAIDDDLAFAFTALASGASKDQSMKPTTRAAMMR